MFFFIMQCACLFFSLFCPFDRCLFQTPYLWSLVSYNNNNRYVHPICFLPATCSRKFISLCIENLRKMLRFFSFLFYCWQFLSSADKPPIEELHQFLEFQLPRQWAPVFGELALGPQRKQQSSASLQFSFMGPKLYVNTTPVMVLVLCFLWNLS